VWPVLADSGISNGVLAKEAVVDARHIKRLKSGKQKGSREVRARLMRVAGAFARKKLGIGAPDDDFSACAQYLRWKG